MPTDQTLLLHRLVRGGTRAASEVPALATTTNSASALVATAMLARDPGHLARATEQPNVARGRHPVAPESHLAGNAYLLNVLVRVHLANRTDHGLAAWIAGQPIPSSDQKENPMSQLSTAPPRTNRQSTARMVARWMVSFLGFPLGGLTAMVLSGPVDSPTAAILGGLLTGTVLGAAQAVAMRFDLLTWVFATAAGLATGLAVGATVVDYRTGLGDLVIQGAISGLGVGAAQSLVLVRGTGPIAFLWPAYLSVAWSIGWAVTTSVGVQVEEQFTVFGAAGAVTVTLLTAVLPVLLHHRFLTEKSS